MRLDLLACRNCGGALARRASELGCTKCPTTYRVEDDVILTSAVSDPAWLIELSRADSPRLALAERVGLRGGPAEEDERSADWRFLVPNSRESVVLVHGVGLGTLATRLAHESAHVVLMDASPARLAFARRRARELGKENVTLIQTTGVDHAPLRAGVIDVAFHFEGFPVIRAKQGVVVLASPWLGPGRERAARRALAQAGFDDIASYAPLPPAGSAPLFLVPRTSDAWGHFMRNILPMILHVSTEVKGSRRRQLALALWSRKFALATGLSSWGRLAAPTLAFVGHREGTSALRAAEAHLGRDVAWLAAAGSVEGGTTTFLAFAAGEVAPIAIAKVHRDADGPRRVVDEEGVLDQLSRLALPGPAPRAIRSLEAAGHSVLLQSVIDGAPMGVTIGRDGLPDAVEARRAFGAARAWSAALARSAGKETIGKPAEEIALAFGERAAPEIGGLASVVQHRDFTRHNLLVDARGNVGVIDWTDATTRGFPMHDLFMFIATYYLQARRGTGVASFTDAFVETFHGQSEFAREAREAVREHARASDLTPHQVNSLFRLFLMERALFERAKSQRAYDRGQLPRFVVWLARELGVAMAEAQRCELWSMFLGEHDRRGGLLLE